MFKVGDVIKYVNELDRIQDHFEIFDIIDGYYGRVVHPVHLHMNFEHIMLINNQYRVELVSRKNSCNYPHEKVRIRYGRI